MSIGQGHGRLPCWSASRCSSGWITSTGGAPAGVAFNPNADAVGAGGFGFTLLNLMGARQSSGAMLLALIVGLSNSLSLFFIVFLFRVLLRRTVLSAIVGIAFLSIVNFGLFPAGLEGWFSVVVVTVVALASTRYGFFTLAVWTWFGQFAEHAMLTPNFGAWYGQSSLLVVVVMTGTALWAFRTSLGGQPLFASSRLMARAT